MIRKQLAHKHQRHIDTAITKVIGIIAPAQAASHVDGDQEEEEEDRRIVSLLD